MKSGCVFLLIGQSPYLQLRWVLTAALTDGVQNCKVIVVPVYILRSWSISQSSSSSPTIRTSLLDGVSGHVLLPFTLLREICVSAISGRILPPILTYIKHFHHKVQWQTILYCHNLHSQIKWNSNKLHFIKAGTNAILWLSNPSWIDSHNFHS